MTISVSNCQPILASPAVLGATKAKHISLATKRPPFQLYDRWKDSYYTGSLHEERPDLVEKYTKFLEAQFEAHQALAQQFTRSEDSPLTPEQLRTLRSLDYIQ